MRRGNRPEEMVALLGTGAIMADTVPPSIVLIVIGSVAGISIAALFASGFVVALFLMVILAAAARQPTQALLSLALGVLLGLLGRDLVRWSLQRRGYRLAHVLAARDEEGALGRLLAVRTDLAARYLDRPA